MNNLFDLRRSRAARRGRSAGGRRYDENGYPIDGLPSDERPNYTNDEFPGLTLKGSNGGSKGNNGKNIPYAENDDGNNPYLGEVTGSGYLYDDFTENGAGGSKGAKGAGGAGGSKGVTASGNSESEYGGSAGNPSGEAAQEESSGGYDFDAGLTDYYNRLYERLRAYGVTSIPTLEALYGLFESFLRPSIEEAIRQRNRQGAYNMAELDADAYSRGMGGSSYLSSMKAREQDDIASDVMGLEAKYSASMAEYLYKALSEMQQLEASLQQTAMQIAAANARAQASASGSSGGRSSSSSRSSSKSSSSSSSEGESDNASHYGHNKNGAYFDGVWYDGDFSYLSNPAGYNDYADYIEGLTAGERYLLFTSSSREWRIRRWQMQYNLAQVDYEDLYNTYYTRPGSGGGGGRWLDALY